MCTKYRCEGSEESWCRSLGEELQARSSHGGWRTQSREGERGAGQGPRFWLVYGARRGDTGAFEKSCPTI